MEEIQKLYKIVENYFRETKIRSFRATKINKNRGLIFTTIKAATEAIGYGL